MARHYECQAVVVTIQGYNGVTASEMAAIPHRWLSEYNAQNAETPWPMMTRAQRNLSRRRGR